MKKIVTILVCLLCAINVSALSYASPYKGAGRNGYVYSSGFLQESRYSSVMAQTPTATMGSISSSSMRGLAVERSNASTSRINVIHTSASQLGGGVTSSDSYARMSAPAIRRAPGDPYPGVPAGGCPHCVWIEGVDEDGDIYYYCSVCGAILDFGCHCGDECHCNAPIGDGRDVWFFVAALASAYAVYKVKARTKDKQIS